MVTGTALTVLWASYVGPTLSLAPWLGIFVCGLCLFQLTHLVSTQTGAFMQYGFWSFVLAWVGIAPLIQLHYSKLPWPDLPTNRLYVPAQLLLIGACLAYLLGSRIGSKREQARLPDQTLVVRHSAQNRTWVPFVALLIVGPYALLKSGGVATRFTSRYAFSQNLQNVGISQATGGSIQIALIQLLPAAAAAALAYCAFADYRNSKGKATRIGKFRIRFYVASSLIAISLFANPLSSSRFLFFSVALAVVFGLYTLSSGRSHRLLALMQVVGLLAIYPLSAWFKLGGQTFSGYNEGAGLNIGTQSFLGVDFDGFQQTVNAIFYVGQSGYGLGRYTVSALGFWIPRSVWSGKTTPASIPVSASRDYVFQNLSLPFWTELFVDFGVPGMLIIMFIFGRISMKLDFRTLGNRNSLAGHLGALAGACQIGFLRGPMGAQMPFFATAVILGFLALRGRRNELGHTRAAKLKASGSQRSEDSKVQAYSGTG